MTIVNPDGPLDPDWLRGPELDLVVELYRDVDWRDEAAVAQRAAELEEWGAVVNDPRNLR